MSAFFFVLMGLAMALTLGVLFTGLIAMARGGDFNRKYSNKLMRMRILAQGLALLFFAVAMLIGTGD
ncbi:MAG: twin transmembrane helix small protein [Rhodovibrionaceae bacterium]|nr:twin transmembrane helix small protein [Rhodovibrionaceae bacterium]